MPIFVAISASRSAYVGVHIIAVHRSSFISLTRCSVEVWPPGNYFRSQFLCAVMPTPEGYEQMIRETEYKPDLTCLNPLEYIIIAQFSAYVSQSAHVSPNLTGFPVVPVV